MAKRDRRAASSRSRSKPATKMGRPSKYTEELAARICEELALGKSLPKICEATDMPSTTTVYRWLESNTDFRNRYARAREFQADTYADQIVDLADGATDHNKARLQIDARKWHASKLRPNKYSERLQHTGKDGAPIAVRQIVDTMTPAEAAEEYARSLEADDD